MPTDIFFRFDANFQETESLCNILCHSFSSSSFPSPMLMLLLLPLFYVFVIFDRKLISIARMRKNENKLLIRGCLILRTFLLSFRVTVVRLSEVNNTSTDAHFRSLSTPYQCISSVLCSRQGLLLSKIWVKRTDQAYYAQRPNRECIVLKEKISNLSFLKVFQICLFFSKIYIIKNGIKNCFNIIINVKDVMA